jgi:multidrug resistance efflux pump
MPHRVRRSAGIALSLLLAVWVASGYILAGDARQSGSGAIVVPQCRIRLNDDVQLSCERTGILDVVVQEGAEVKAGSIVAKIRDDEVRANLAVISKEASNDIEVRFAQKATELAQIKYLRALDANKASPGAVPELELRELRLLADKSLLQLEQAKHQFELAALRRNEITERMKSYYVSAPFDAFVSQVHKQPGEVVREGEPVLELANTRLVRVEGYLDVAHVRRVRIGNPVSVSLSSGTDASDGAFPGRISFVDVKVEPVTQKVRFWATVENRDNSLKDGLLADITIEVESP